ncbi:palmitoyl-CoA hydrolase [Catellatospora sp. TT07R-123]|nr:palmitoyl-CoA hydrolase [Catellatospora sp. TT07R-123]
MSGLLGAAVILLAATASAGPDRDWSASVAIDAPDALADQPVHIRLYGIPAGRAVTVRLTAAAYDRSQWRSQALFTADGTGTVDLDRAASLGGTYSGVDGMGLFSSLVPPAGDPDRVQFLPLFPEAAASYEVKLTVWDGRRAAGGRVLHRIWTGAGVTHQVLTPGGDGLDGVYFAPPATAHGVAVLAFGGSEGGNGEKYTAALLASHGVPALALAYFARPGLPGALRDVPLEYFDRAITRLHELSGLPVVLLGFSRGTEAALLSAEAFPRWVRGIVAYAPTDTVHAGYPSGAEAWTLHAAPVSPGTRLKAVVPLLAIAGDADGLWPSAAAALALGGSGARVLIYPGAGHLVGTFPYLPAGVRPTHPLTGAELDMGGSRAGDAAARRDGWPRVLAFLGAPTAP